MRIVHVITRFLNAGAEENTLLSCNGQVEAGHEVHLIYGPDHNPETCDLLDSRVVQHVSPDLVRPVHPAKDLRALNDLTRIFNVLRPDIVHTHTSKAGIVGRFAASRAKVPCIIHGVHILPFLNVSFVHKWVYLVLEKLAARVTDAFINVSEGMKQANLQYCVGKEAQHYVVPSGMDVAAFREAVAPADWRAFFGKAAEKITSEQPQFVIFVGAFEARKRHVPFLHVFREVVHSCPNAVLLLLGEGKEEPVIRETILSLGLERHVILAGFRRDVAECLRMARVGVLPSEREGLARVVIQYTLSGLPVVATHTQGIEQIVTEGESGYLVPVDDVAAMAVPIQQLLQDKALHDAMAQAAREKDLSAWSADHMVTEIEKIYRLHARG